MSFTGGFFLYMALLVLLLPLRWVLAALIAAAFHELCHLAAIKVMKLPVISLRIGAGGAKIETLPMTPGQELICALAGPLGALVLILFVRWIPMIAVCAGLQSFYNLLPVYPLDGGRALRSAASLFLRDEQVEKLCFWVQTTCVTGLLCLGIWGCFRLRLGLVPAVAAAVLAVKALKLKNSLQTEA